MANPFLGEIKIVGFSFAPVGWALCNGALMSIAQAEALFQLLGTIYGGDGISTFALPDFRGRIPIHMGQGTGLSPYAIGGMAGSENVTLQPAQLPSHHHGLQATQDAAATAIPSPDALLGVTAVPTYFPGPATAAMSAQSIGLTGKSLPHDNTMPFVCLNFIIALEGIFPSRN
jgi:microcystin-dependent protein